MAIVIDESSILPIRGLIYYLRHKERLSDKNCIARQLMTRYPKDPQGIIQTIHFMLTHEIGVSKNLSEAFDWKVTPDYKLSPGDHIGMPVIMGTRIWKYDGQKLIFTYDS